MAWPLLLRLFFLLWLWWELDSDCLFDSLFEIVSEGFDDYADDVEFWEEFPCAYCVGVLKDRVSFGGDEDCEDGDDVFVFLDSESFEDECEAEDDDESDELFHCSEPRKMAFDL